MENSNIERETVTEERTNVTITAPISENDAKFIIAYAEMTKIDQGILLNKMIKHGLKEIRGKLDNLPYTSSKELIDKYNELKIS